VNNKLKRVWREVVVANLIDLSQHLSGGADRNHEKPQSEWSVSNRTPPEYKSEILPLGGNYSLINFMKIQLKQKILLAGIFFSLVNILKVINCT
jgi:hypothetical protein